MAAGERFGFSIEIGAELQDLRRLLDGGLDFGFGPPRQGHAKADILGDSHVRVERVGLKDHGDLAVFGLGVGDVAAADGQSAAGDLF